jgi:hypothetical protein
MNGLAAVSFFTGTALDSFVMISTFLDELTDTFNMALFANPMAEDIWLILT